MSEDQGVMVRTDVAADGTYVVNIEFGPDHALPVDPQRAYRYAATVMAAAARAEYDAAVIAQLTHKLELPREEAAKVVAEMRDDRPPLDTDATAPLALEPGVSAFTGSGFLAVVIAGKHVGQWTPGDARHHAQGVLEAVEVADLDATYHRYLAGSIGIDSDRARAVIDDLASWREEEPS